MMCACQRYSCMCLSREANRTTPTFPLSEVILYIISDLGVCEGAHIISGLAQPRHWHKNHFPLA